METIKNALDFSDFPRFDLIIAGLVFLFLLTFPVFPFSAFAMATMIQFLMFSLYGMGWNTIGGYGGQVDLGKAQYVGIGAYTTAVMLIRWDIPFWVSMPIGVFFAVCWSFIGDISNPRAAPTKSHTSKRSLSTRDVAMVAMAK